jgi:hypothetical protein
VGSIRVSFFAVGVFLDGNAFTGMVRKDRKKQRLQPVTGNRSSKIKANEKKSTDRKSDGKGKSHDTIEETIFDTHKNERQLELKVNRAPSRAAQC